MGLSVHAPRLFTVLCGWDMSYCRFFGSRVRAFAATTAATIAKPKPTRIAAPLDRLLSFLDLFYHGTTGYVLQVLRGLLQHWERSERLRRESGKVACLFPSVPASITLQISSSHVVLHHERQDTWLGNPELEWKDTVAR